MFLIRNVSNKKISEQVGNFTHDTWKLSIFYSLFKILLIKNYCVYDFSKEESRNMSIGLLVIYLITIYLSNYLVIYLIIIGLIFNI